MSRAHHDFETASALDLKRVGVHVYAAHPSTFIWCMAWRLDAQPVQMWRPGAPDPVPLLNHIYAGGTIVAHNAAFERTIWNTLVPPYWPSVTIEQQDCTLARAQAVSLPAGLDMLCQALRLEQRKDAEGARLMKQMMKPRKVNADGSYVWWDDEPRRQRLEAYCVQDVIVESKIDELLPALSERERRVWELDQRINDRGVYLDRPMIQKMQLVVESAKGALDDRMAEVTRGAVKKCSQNARLVQWLNGSGIACKSVAAEDHEALLDGITPELIEAPAIREALQLRSEAAKSSTAKLSAMEDTLGADGRSRGLVAYHATLQGRWAGRLWQPQNVKTREDEDMPDVNLAMQIAETMHDPAAIIGMFNIVIDRPPMELCSLALRSQIIAAPGNHLIGGDKSNIEGRINAWLSGEDWKIAAFRDYDYGVGPDLYRVAYASSFGVHIDTVRGASRSVGKVQELALGYQGSVVAYVKMARKKGVKLDKVRDTVKAAASPVEWSMALRDYPSARNKAGLDAETWAAVAIVVKRWRAQNSAIVQGWWDLQDAAIEAVAHPGAVVAVFGGRVRYLSARGFLWCGLPSGRVLAYHRPELRVVDTSYWLFPDGTRRDATDFFTEEAAGLEAAGAKLVRRNKHAVFFEHKTDSGLWGRDALYGGMQCAHVVSGIARDCLVEDMFEAERRGYPIVLTVHDELLAEMAVGQGDPSELAEIMSKVPVWIDGDLPLAAKCWEGRRYGK